MSLLTLNVPDHQLLLNNMWDGWKIMGKFWVICTIIRSRRIARFS